MKAQKKKEGRRKCSLSFKTNVDRLTINLNISENK